MSDLSLNNDPNMVIKARFLEKGNSHPLHAKDYSVRLYDKDLFDDDFLGEAVPDENGFVIISFSHDAFNKGNISLDTYPDLYFVIVKNGVAVTRTRVLENIHSEDIRQFMMGQGEILNLGTYLVDVAG
jgi:hypothetical protein